jgi:hypothetical protein
VSTRGTGWDADTLTGLGSAAGRHAQRQEGAGAGVYRSTSTEPTEDQAPWLPDLRSTGKHAAVD